VSNSLQNQINPARQVASHLDIPRRIRKRPKSAEKFFFFGTCTPQDLTPSFLNQIARRDLHWLILPVEQVLMYPACDLVQAWPSKNRDRDLMK
jgi:hypothetical protein